MVQLTNDSVASVRDWATFGLGTLVDVDTRLIRRALWARMKDGDETVRGEALVGLARRKDRRIRTYIIKDLVRTDAGTLIFEAAEEYGDPTLLPYLETHLKVSRKQEGVDQIWLWHLKRSIKALKR